MRTAAGPRRAGTFAALVPALLLAGGCAAARHALQGEEARMASGFFFAAAAVNFPVVASFSGSAEISGRTVPLVAAVNSRSPDRESAGLYDPLGRAVLFLDNAGGKISVTRGPAAGEYLAGGLGRMPDGEVVLGADGFSLGRVLAGAPGFPVSGGEPGRTADGAWVLDDGFQTLFTDPARRLLARAEYGIAGKRIAVSYPGREGSGPPRIVTIELRGATMTLRRDDE
ncbi:MAG: hypothetical protein ACM31I_06920 [Deltaproteobacteria bacterium]